jgi:hypothetical protein
MQHHVNTLTQQSTSLIWHAETARIVKLFPDQGIFLTGIEGSDPHIDGVRRNQLQEAHNFYENYETRLKNIRALGITWLRFGMPYSQVHLAPYEYDFSFMDKIVATCNELGITIMADLLHFGLPDWMHEDSTDQPFFQNAIFPMQFARYAEAFAKRYPHITHYTIVNEPFVTAYLSSKLGLWNEHRSGSWDDDSAYVRATTNIARAAILGRKAIESVWMQEERTEELLFIQNESFERAYAAPYSGREAEAEAFNLRRFAPLDLIFGRPDAAMQHYLLRYGMTENTYNWFMEHGRMDKTILGIDHYPTCIHTYERDRTIDHGPDTPYQLYTLTKEYWQRYPLPLMHTEVNAWPQHAIAICNKTFDSLNQLRQEGYPVLGMGWYGDDLQIGWHVAMHGDRGREECPVGLFYKGQSQPVAERFQQMNQIGFTPIAQPQMITQPDKVTNY